MYKYELNPIKENIDCKAWALDAYCLLDQIELALADGDMTEAYQLCKGRFFLAEKYGLEVKDLGQAETMEVQ